MGRRKITKIKCPDFREGKQIICLAYPDGLMVPSVEELVNFCLSGQHRNCPLKARIQKELRR